MTAVSSPSRPIPGTPPPGFNAGQRDLYVVIGTRPDPVIEPNGSIALDRAQEARLSRSGESLTFPIGQENAKNIISYDVSSGTSRPALQSVPGAIEGGCPLYDDVTDVLLFETDVGIDNDDTNSARDLYIAFNPFGAAPSVQRVGAGLLADTGASNFLHSCLGATFAPVDDGFDVVIVSTDRLTAEDTDSSADVYRATVQPADRLVGCP